MHRGKNVFGKKEASNYGEDRTHATVEDGEDRHGKYSHSSSEIHARIIRKETIFNPSRNTIKTRGKNAE